MAGAKTSSHRPWVWIPTLYVAEGLPYALAMSVSVVLYKNLGVSNAAIAFWTGLLGWPWVIKPLWSPVVDIFPTWTALVLTLPTAAPIPASQAQSSNITASILTPAPPRTGRGVVDVEAVAVPPVRHPPLPSR